MAVRRDSLRARDDFFSPMTGNQSGTRFAGERRGSYTDEAKRRLQDLDTGRTESPVIEAIKVALEKTPDPFTKIPTKKSYAPEEDQGLAGVLEGLGDGAGEEVVKAVGDFIEPITSGRSGASPNDKRLQRQADFDANPPARASTSQLIARDNRRYGNTFPSGSMGSGSEATIKASPTSKVDTNIARHSVGGPGDQPPKPQETRTYYGQGGLPLGTTTQRQGGEVKDGKYVGPQEKGPAINASSFQQKNVRGSAFNTGKDESARPKTVTIGGQTVAARQTVASLPSNYKSTEAKAFAAAKAFKGQQAAAKAASEGKNKAQQAAAARKATGTSVSAAKAANTASMKAAAAARHASFKKAKAAGTHARTASAQRARNKAAAKARAKAAAKRRRSKKSCPDPSMLILMANGLQKRAGDLMVGDLIKTNHEKDMKLGEYKVEYVNVVNDIPKTKLIFEESEIVCSLTHKFYVGNDWKAAEDMVIGDEVSGQKLISIENVEDGDVVHITVEDAHTYICEGLLSHNKRCDIRTKDNISKLTDMNLLRDDLANVAYFVKELQETI